MTLRLVTPPAEYPVTLEEAKEHLRVADDSEDTLIQSYVAAATAYVEGYTGRALMEQTWELVQDAFADTVKLIKGPVQSISFVKYYDEDGVLQTIAGDSYSLDNVSDPAWLVRATDYSWPSVADGVNNVVIRFVAGYEDAADIPALLIAAVKLALTAMYEDRTNPDFAGAMRCADLHRPVFV